VRRGDPSDWAASWRAFAGLDVQGRLAGFAAPTLILVGEADASTTPEIMAGIAQRIPGSSGRGSWPIPPDGSDLRRARTGAFRTLPVDPLGAG